MTDDLGGDPVCWLDRVCPDCGAFLPDGPGHGCPRCGPTSGTPTVDGFAG
ncbi:hypothetical protein GCM10023094_02280 [Rhodococcus olei]|uniref:Uncharacterized protein n=1 Tax=Rhodococcus olei TaxID=2161675 RepID=A0ABP8NR79_9NOCA